ncbi:hypothetical protein KQX54_019845 [Cotesia glomerata]|uniref:Uncharacterized protein n=1 Tax=Cotesia glomerata TaxID=32391 RepID=A0AAV7I2J1_COTGL|nr:hypothetical protein KQX54_019845 [Cotesia glomerata]
MHRLQPRRRKEKESGMTEYEQEKVLDQLEAPELRQPIPDREEDDQPRLQKIVFHEISDLRANDRYTPGQVTSQDKLAVETNASQKSLS